MQSVKLHLSIEKRYEYVEAFRNLRTNIELYGNDSKSIAITSIKPQEGKSTVALQLAESLAEVGKKVVFLDLDLRRSDISDKNCIDDMEKGIIQFLNEKYILEDIVFNTNIMNLDIIFSGGKTPNSTELINSENFTKLIMGLKNKYDYIIVDTPSIGSISDALLIIKQCEQVVLVIEENKVSRKEAKELVDKIDELEGNLLGVVINKAVIKENLNLDNKYYDV